MAYKATPGKFGSSVIFITAEQWFAMGDWDGWVHICAYDTKLKVKEFEAYSDDRVSSLAVHPTHPFLLTSSGSGTLIKLWDWEQDWMCTRTFDTEEYVSHVTWNPTETNIFATILDSYEVKVCLYTSSSVLLVINLALTFFKRNYI